MKKVISADTYQFDDYSNYATSNIEIEQKIHSKNTQFPIDCHKAFSIGKELTGN